MHPDFEHYRGGKPAVTITARVPERLKKAIELIADIEGDSSIAGLVTEALARVVEDRFSEEGIKKLEDELAESSTKRQAKIEMGRRVTEQIRADRADS